MLCLGIESSCDDTSLALVRDGLLIGQLSTTQAEVHALFGGVVPEMASREHARYIGLLFDALLDQCQISSRDIDTVAVARGPGLLGSLLVGVAFAKALALGIGAKFIGINHLHAHIIAVGLEQPILFPALALLVSGGHTHIYRVDSPDSFHLLGKTLDDAAGEAFDKAGKMLGLAYPAGKEIDALSCEGRLQENMFPVPYVTNTNLDFSFSGLKTAIASYINKCPNIALHVVKTGDDPHEYRQHLSDVCASYSYAIVEALAIKAERAFALPESTDIRSLILAGGVASNSSLRKRMNALATKRDIHFFCPSTGLCTDNGAMIAYLGYLLASKGYEHSLSMEAIPRGRKIPIDMKKAYV